MLAFRIELDRLFEVFRSFLELAKLQVNLAAVGQGIWILREDVQRKSITRNRDIILFLFLVNGAQDPVDVRIFAIENRQALENPLGFVQLSLRIVVVSG